MGLPYLRLRPAPCSLLPLSGASPRRSFQGTVTPANANLLAFADRLEELDLDIETFIPVHGQRATAEQFWEAIKLGREQN